jgi:hypothetical protein
MLGAAGKRPQYWWDLGQNDDSVLGGLLGTHVRASSATYVDSDDDLVKSAATNIPRYETVSSQAALLIEPAGTNLIHYSHELNELWWVTNRLTRSVDGLLGPDGTTAADGLISTSVSNTHFLSAPVMTGIAQNDKIAFTVYAKPGAEDWLVVILYFYNAAHAEVGVGYYYFNIATGTIGSKIESGDGTVSDYIIESATNGFYRVGIIASCSNAGTAEIRGHYFCAEADNDVTFAGDNSTVTTWVWGADLKKQAYFDSYVITSGATAARATESGYPLWTNPSGLFDSTFTASMWVRFAFAEADVSTDGGILACKDATASLLYHDVSGNGIAIHDGTTEITVALAFAKNTWYKLVVKAQVGGNFNVGYDSGSGITWGTAAAFDGDFNAAGAGLQLGRALQGPMWIRDLRLYDHILSDSQINSLGSP